MKAFAWICGGVCETQHGSLATFKKNSTNPQNERVHDACQPACGSWRPGPHGWSHPSIYPPPSRPKTNESQHHLAQIHRVVAGTGIMGGDVEGFRGKRSHSAFSGLRFFPDEAFLIPHT